MKGIAFAACVIATLAKADEQPTIDLAQFEEKTFMNKVDHFNFLDEREYAQRYWVSDQYWDGEGPIFLYICGEYRCSVPDTRLYPFMVGANYNARFMVLEHRFYGDSQPFDSWDLESLSYLNSQQALADLAYFLGSMNPDNAVEALVIGGSYAGALSTWFKQKYPHLAVGAYSSSALIKPIVDFWRFDWQIYATLNLSGEWCPTMVQKSMEFVTQQGVLRDHGFIKNAIDATLEGTGTEGIRTDDWMYYYADIFAKSVQNGKRTAICDNLQGLQTSTQAEIVEAMVAFGQSVAGVNPVDYDTRVIAQTDVDPQSSVRPWTFQQCSEFGWFQVPSQQHPMRSTMLGSKYWYDMCQRSFGKGMPTEPKALASTIENVYGVVLPGQPIFIAQGLEDPWKWASMTDAQTSNCPNCSNCVDLYTPTDADAPELQATRQMITQWIDSILTKKPATFLQ